MSVRRILLVGPGQLGRVIAGGLVACSVSVDPVRRGEAIAPGPEHDLVIVAVGENELAGVLHSIPPTHHARVVLLQNELVPASWERSGIESPTVLVVWFEKKKGRPIQVVRRTEIAGLHAGLFVRALEAMGVPAEEIPKDALAGALVTKNLYIVGANAMGLAVAGTTGELASTHRVRTDRVLREVLAIERSRLDSNGSLRGRIDDEDMIARTFEAFLADPQHGTVGRTAKERLARARERAKHAGLVTPELDASAAGALA
ncbi:MAG: hypothetical protein ACK6CU_05090 [Deltaproteobacteria bacterium]